MSERPFRVGLQLRASDPAEAAEEAQRAEELGFDIVLVADHVGSDHSPLLMLAAAAHATQRVRLGTYVLNCCLHHPVMLARDVVTLDHLSGGRVELGLGAGHTRPSSQRRVCRCSRHVSERSDSPSSSRSCGRCSTAAPLTTTAIASTSPAPPT